MVVKGSQAGLQHEARDSQRVRTPQLVQGVPHGHKSGAVEGEEGQGTPRSLPH